MADNNEDFHQLYEDTFKKRKTAVALGYEKGEKAPKVLASGQGYIADKIISQAEEADVPVHKDEKLAESLEKIEIGEFIPPELYKVVAEVLVFVDSMDRIKNKMTDGSKI